MANKVDNCGLVLSTADARPRLKWTHQLHQCFVEAVSQLGGAEKATPKSVMRVMGIPGITLYHLKSHLQKYRLAKNRGHKANNKDEDTMAADYMPIKNIISHVDEHRIQPPFHNSRAMLELQMEVQRKLQEQIEVQKHLQLRIEAQGKYLRSVLRKAQETLASYNLNSMEVEDSKAELTELVSAVDNVCPSYFFSQGSSVSKQILNADYSAGSCITCSDRPNPETSDCSNNWIAESSDDKKDDMESGDFSERGKRIRCVYENKQSIVFPEEIDLNR